MTKMLGLLGYPVGHSASPAMMNRAFAVLSMDATYLSFSVEPNNIHDALAGLVALGAHGVNVTIPHKRSVFRWVSSLTDEAKLVGAVNTVRFDKKFGPLGHNTDVSGWWASIKHKLHANVQSLALLGTGGAAQAVLAALTLYRSDIAVSLIGRNRDRVQELQSQFGHHIKIQAVSWELREHVIANSQCVIQSTPIGMWPHQEDSPIENPRIFSQGQIVQDIVYRPRYTKLMRDAKACGADVLDGMSMLVYQGIHAFEWWFDRPAPTADMFTAVETFLEQDVTRQKNES